MNIEKKKKMLKIGSMSCFYPKLAVDYGLDHEGKHMIKFIPERPDYNINMLRSRYGQSLLLLPCGQCLGCKFDRAKDWATRCVCESYYHKESSFITLTYDDDHLGDNKLARSDILDFIKALRNRGVRLRYFGCGEYGSEKGRKHFHVILFGYFPEDAVIYSKSNGFYLYTSDFLSSLWSKGYVLVGDLTFESAGYVARYATKKLDDEDSFLFMSNRPGIGYQYLLDHKEVLLHDDCIYGDFGKCKTVPLPRYFDSKLRDWYPEEYSKLVYNRLKNIQVIDNNDLINKKYVHLERLKIDKAFALADKLSRIGRL